MPGVVTNGVAVKKELIRRLKLESALTDVQVLYGMDAKRLEREIIYGGRVQGPVSPAAMRTPGNRQPREDQPTILVHARVWAPGADPGDSACEERAVALLSAVSDMVTADPGLAGAVPGLLSLLPEDVDVQSGAGDDDAALTIATLTLVAHSFLT